MDFSGALRAMKCDRRRVARFGWNGKNMWLQHIVDGSFQISEQGTEMLEPFIVMRTAQGLFVPWLCSQSDMLAEDWHVV